MKTANAMGLALVLLGGCASILDRRTQEISIDTDPSGASCKLVRSGTIISELEKTPGQVTVRKSTYDIVIVCTKEGYQQTSYTDEADVSTGSVASSLIGGGLGWAVDSTTGTANKYESNVLIKMTTIPQE